MGVSRDTIQETGSDQVLALVETDQALCQVHLRIAREDDDASADGHAVGRIEVGGIGFTIFAEDRDAAKGLDGLLLLTNREMQIACLIQQGACNKQIARRLRISPYTVASYLKRMFPKLGCSSRAEIAAKVARVQSVSRMKAT